MSLIAHIYKMCRVCCDRQTSNNLIFLLDAENKTIVKKMRACADIAIEPDDLLPKYICTKCLQNLNTAYMFKIQCEYMDQRLRESISSGLQKHANMQITVQNHDNYSSSDSSDTENDDIFQPNSMATTMDEFSSDNNNCRRNDPTSSSDQNYHSQFNAFHQTNPAAANDPANPNNNDESAMEVSPTLKSPLPNTKATDECNDAEMQSVKSDPESKPSTRRRLLRCEICGANFLSRSECNKHIRSHGKYRYQCSLCSRRFEQRYQLNIHHRSHSAVKSFKCTLCERRYTNQTNLDRHIRVIHKRERQHTCSTCQRTFTQLESLRIHQSVHEAERQFGCDICHQKFKSEIDLKLHRKRHLPTEYRLKRKYTPPKKTYKSSLKLCVCSECGKRFTSIAMLRSHMQSHAQVKKYECQFCKKRFVFQQALRNHTFVHTGEKRFKCDVCNTSFRHISHLQDHKLVHSGLKSHSCTFCGKAFALRSKLMIHMRIHSGEASNVCKIDPKQFDDGKVLEEHLLENKSKNQAILNGRVLPSTEQTAKRSAKRPAEASDVEETSTQYAIDQMPPATVKPLVKWALDQNAAAFQMTKTEPSFQNGAMHSDNPGPLNATPAQSFDDISKLFLRPE